MHNRFSSVDNVEYIFTDIGKGKMPARMANEVVQPNLVFKPIQDMKKAIIAAKSVEDVKKVSLPIKSAQEVVTKANTVTMSDGDVVREKAPVKCIQDVARDKMVTGPIQAVAKEQKPGQATEALEKGKTAVKPLQPAKKVILLVRPAQPAVNKNAAVKPIEIDVTRKFPAKAIQGDKETKVAVRSIQAALKDDMQVNPSQDTRKGDMPTKSIQDTPKEGNTSHESQSHTILRHDGHAFLQNYIKGTMLDPHKYGTPKAKSSGKVDKATDPKVVSKRNTTISDTRDIPAPDNSKKAVGNKVQPDDGASMKKAKPFQAAIPLNFQAKSGNINKEKMLEKDRSSSISNNTTLKVQTPKTSNSTPTSKSPEKRPPGNVSNQATPNFQISKPAINNAITNSKNPVHSTTENLPVDDKVAVKPRVPYHENVKGFQKTGQASYNPRLTSSSTSSNKTQYSNSGRDRYNTHNSNHKKDNRNNRQSRGSKGSPPINDDPIVSAWNFRAKNAAQFDAARKAEIEKQYADHEARLITAKSSSITSVQGEESKTSTMDKKSLDPDSVSKGKNKVVNDTSQAVSDYTSPKIGAAGLPGNNTVQTGTAGNMPFSNDNNNNKPGQYRNKYQSRNYGYNRRKDNQTDPGTSLKAMQDRWQAQQGATMIAVGAQVGMIRDGSSTG